MPAVVADLKGDQDRRVCTEMYLNFIFKSYKNDQDGYHGEADCLPPTGGLIKVKDRKGQKYAPGNFLTRVEHSRQILRPSSKSVTLAQTPAFNRM